MLRRGSNHGRMQDLISSTDIRLAMTAANQESLVKASGKILTRVPYLKAGRSGSKGYGKAIRFRQ